MYYGWKACIHEIKALLYYKDSRNAVGSVVTNSFQSGEIRF